MDLEIARDKGGRAVLQDNGRSLKMVPGAQSFAQVKGGGNRAAIHEHLPFLNHSILGRLLGFQGKPGDGHLRKSSGTPDSEVDDFRRKPGIGIAIELLMQLVKALTKIVAKGKVQLIGLSYT